MLNIMGKIFPLPCNLTSVCNSCNTCLFFLLYQLIQVLEVMPDLLHAKFNCILLPVEIVMWNCQLDCILYFLVKIHQPHCNSETLLLFISLLKSQGWSLNLDFDSKTLCIQLKQRSDLAIYRSGLETRLNPLRSPSSGI